MNCLVQLYTAVFTKISHKLTNSNTYRSELVIKSQSDLHVQEHLERSNGPIGDCITDCICGLDLFCQLMSQNNYCKYPHSECPTGTAGNYETLLLVKCCFDSMVSDGWRTHRCSMCLRQHCVAATYGGFRSVWNGGSFRW